MIFTCETLRCCDTLLLRSSIGDRSLFLSFFLDQMRIEKSTALDLDSSLPVSRTMEQIGETEASSWFIWILIGCFTAFTCNWKAGTSEEGRCVILRPTQSTETPVDQLG